MPRFFVTTEQIDGDVIHISGDDARHISKSLRMKKGEIIVVCDMRRNEYRCEIAGFTADKVTAKIHDTSVATNEPPCFIKLFQALPKSDKLDFIIQKAVECGVGEIIPFESERCVAKSKSEDEPRKTARRKMPPKPPNSVAGPPFRRCGRRQIRSALSEAAKSDVGIFCYEGDGTTPLGEVLKTAFLCREPQTVSVIIGSEGGFSGAEAKRALSCGLVPAGL